MVILYVLDIVVPFLIIGEVYSTDDSTPFCTQSTETQPNPCCLCAANTSCDLTCPREWKKIRGYEIKCPNPNINITKSYNTDEFQNDDEDLGARYSDDSEISLTPIGTLSLDNYNLGVYCMAECPVRTFYNHQDLKCHPCDPSCKACDGPNATGCTACEFETEDGCLKECPTGWKPILDRKGPRRGTVCTIRIDINDGKPKPIFIKPETILVAVVVTVAVVFTPLTALICWYKCCFRGRTDVRGKYYFDATDFTDERQSFTGPTPRARQEPYCTRVAQDNHVDEGYEEMGVPNPSKGPTPRAGQEPYLTRVTRVINVEEGYEEMMVTYHAKSRTPRAGQEPYLARVADIIHDGAAYEKMGLPNQSKGSTPRAGQVPFLTPVAKGAEIDINSINKDRKCVVEINECLNRGGDDGMAAANPDGDYMVPISRTAKDVSTSDTIDNINLNDGITQIQTEQTDEGIMGDCTEGKVYTRVTDNIGFPMDMAVAGTESDSAKQLNFP